MRQSLGCHASSSYCCGNGGSGEAPQGSAEAAAAGGLRFLVHASGPRPLRVP
jgi:hypothetical protein